MHSNTTLPNAQSVIDAINAANAGRDAAIKELIDRRDTLTKDYEDSMAKIAADLKTLGYKRAPKGEGKRTRKAAK
jgi:ABC-type transporter Mla subunit MlaD